MKTTVIGIAGGSGSGKSTLAQRLENYFSEKLVKLSCDNYYYPHDDIPFEQRRFLNYDIPEAIEFELLINHINELRNGNSVNCPVYDFSLHTRSDETIYIKPQPIIVIDGILSLAYENLKNLMDIKVFVDTDADERILRRVRRDMTERNRDINDIIEQYVLSVKPMHYKYVEPSKKCADIVLNGGLNDVAFDLLKTGIENILEEG